MSVFWTSLLEFASPRTFLVVIKFLPVLLIVMLMAPAFMAWPLLRSDKHEALLQVMQKLIDWTRASSRA